MLELDKKDKKILEVLDQHGRASVSEISRKTGIPRDSVHYRIQRLIKSKVIRFFHVVLNPTELNHPIFTYVSFNFYNLDEQKEKKFYQTLQNNSNVVYVAKTTGKWDCLIAISAKNLEHLDKILREIRKDFSGIIKEFETSSIISELKYDSMVNLIEK